MAADRSPRRLTSTSWGWLNKLDTHFLEYIARSMGLYRSLRAIMAAHFTGGLLANGLRSANLEKWA